jgi:hypothetical protein
MRTLLSLLVVATLAPAPALAWGQTGHRVTGAIADRYLGPKARAALKDILGTESLAEASTWPDFMRADPSDFWQKQASPWHYVTVPAGKRWEQTTPPPEGDAILALRRFAATVRDPRAPLAERQKALRFIVHIAGDLSQPLHAGRPGDSGGNEVKLTFFGAPTNLHAIWDSGLIDRLGLSYSEWADWLAANATPDELRAWSSPDPLDWVADSVTVRETLYPPPGTTELGYAYAFQQDRTLKQQLAKGGLRIAAHLNRLFDEAPQERPR